MQFNASIRPDATTFSPSSCIDYGGLYRENNHIGVNLFENKNYQVILDHLDSGKFSFSLFQYHFY